MTDETNIWSQIEDYFIGNMNVEEKEAFEKSISSDPELADMVASYNLTENVAVVHEALQLKAQMNIDLAEPKSNRTKYWPLAAIGALIGFGVYFMFPTPKTEQKETVSKTIIKEDSVFISEKTEWKKTSEKAPEKKISTIISRPKVEQKEQLTEQPIPISEAKKEVEPTKEVEKAAITEQNIQEKVNPCAGLVIDLDFYTLPSCKGLSTGEIHIKPKSVKGGIAPYSYSLAPNKDFGSVSIKEKAEGNYQLFVKDGNACVVAVAKPVSIGSINCNESKDFTYSPSHDPAWLIPYDANKSARSIKIVNKGGNEVFQSLVNAGNPSEWNGESNSGKLIETGYYLYFIEYSDGTLDKGAISILR